MIVKTEYATRVAPLTDREIRYPHLTENVSGEIVTTENGDKWFHPYNGKSPWKLNEGDN